MAIFQIQPLLLLLASLFFLPSSSAVDFEYCNKIGYEYANVSRIEISPNPVGPNDNPTLKIFGSTKMYNIVDGTLEVSLQVGDYSIPQKDYHICDVVRSCFIPFDTNYELTLSEFRTFSFQGHQKYGVNFTDHHKRTVVCFTFDLPSSASALVSR